MPSLRYRIEHSWILANLLARIASSYLRLCNATTRWDKTGLEALEADLATGPVLVVTWHERLLMGPVHWPVAAGQLSSLYASSAIGRVSGAMQRQFGLQPMEMSENATNIAASRIILSRVRDGVSIGMTVDGPLGPARVVKNAPIDWARVMQRPVYVFAFSTKRHKRLGSWDRMLLPLPFTRGKVVFEKWQEVVPRKADAEVAEKLRASLARLLERVAEKVDRTD